MQQVEFPSLNKCDGAKYYDAIVAMYQKVKREKPDDRTFKRYLRGEGWLDKESFDQAAKLLDMKVVEGGSVSLGTWANAWIDQTNEDRRKADLFVRLAGLNEILVKYVFEAVEERLYSTSELYRMLTSYVYPGKRVDLPHFKNWLCWLQATDRIRVLGIRWAPGRKFEESKNYIASIDVDELLEDEAEDELFGADEGADDADAPESSEASPDEATSAEDEAPEEVFEEAPAAPAAPAPAHRPAPAAAAPAPAATGGGGGGGGGGVSAEQLAALLAAISAPRPQAQEVIEARLLKPAPHLSALAAGAPLERVREAMAAEPADPDAWSAGLEPDEEARAENVRELMEWWMEVEERPALRADHHGLMPFGEGGWAEGTRARFLFKLACLAVSLLRHPEDGEVSFGVLESAGFYGALYDAPGSAERLLDELFEQGLGGRPELFRDLHLVLMLARALRGAESWVAELPELEASEVYARLWQRLGAFNLHAEVLWVVRELSLFGVLRQPELRSTRVVPTEEARRAAFHLGLLESARAVGLPGLLLASRRLTILMDSDLEAPLVMFWRRYGAHPPRRFWSR